MPNCPTPKKRPFRSKAEAARWQRQRYFRKGKARLYPYLCPSEDHWHLTHQTPEEQARIAAYLGKKTDA